MKIASWNVNSVRLRAPLICQWLKDTQPDIVCLQELKCEDKNFPEAPFADLGYNIACYGQKTYNGVALLSKSPLEDVKRGLTDKPQEEESRYIEAVAASKDMVVRVGGLYAPNGNPAPGPKFDKKLKWMEAFHTHAQNLLQHEEILLLAGDYNIIPQPEDCYDATAWEGDALFRDESRAAWRALTHLGFADACQIAYRDTDEPYTFWDYQGGAFRKNHGIRIDHFLLSPQATDRLKACGIDKQYRAEEKPSDHVPIWVELE